MATSFTADFVTLELAPCHTLDFVVCKVIREQAKGPSRRAQEGHKLVRIRNTGGRLLTTTLLSLATAVSAAAQQAEPATRQAAIEQEQAEKVKALQPYTPNKGERLANRIEEIMTRGVPKWHPFFD